MLAQCDVPGINMDSSDALWFVSTLNACQGSMDPVMANAKSQCKKNDLSQLFLGLRRVFSQQKRRRAADLAD